MVTEEQSSDRILSKMLELMPESERIFSVWLRCNQDKKRNQEGFVSFLQALEDGKKAGDISAAYTIILVERELKEAGKKAREEIRQRNKERDEAVKNLYYSYKQIREAEDEALETLLKDF